MVWGVVDERAIAPDSGAKTWATRREQLTNQYVSRLAAQAKGQPVEDDLDDDVGASGRPSLVSGSPENSADFKSKNQNLSALDADALQVGVGGNEGGRGGICRAVVRCCGTRWFLR